MFFTQLYMLWQEKYSHVHKKALNKKKCLLLFNKKHFYMLGQAQNRKIVSNCQATNQKELCLLLEKSSIFFSQSKCADRLDPPSPFSFVHSFMDLIHPPPFPSFIHSFIYLSNVGQKNYMQKVTIMLLNQNRPKII